MARSRRFLAVLALAAVALAACTSQDADRDDVANAMEEAGASEEQADCVADGLEDELSQDQLNEVADASDLEDDLEDDLRETVEGVLNDCLASGEGEGGDGDSTDDTSEESTTTTTEG